MIDASKPPCHFCEDKNHSMIDCPDFISLRNSAAAQREKWHSEHQCCPECNHDSMPTTFGGAIQIIGADYEDDVNYSWCDKCGWKGMIKDLKPKNII